MHSNPAVCYDIRSSFTRSLELKVCPVCGRYLGRTQTHPSIAGRFFAMQASISLIEIEWLRCAAGGPFVKFVRTVSWRKSRLLSRTQAQRLFGPMGQRNPAKRIKNTSS